MTLQYIHHSCFALVEDGLLLVYDYWRDPDGRLRPLLDEAGRSGKSVYFVISHFHEDHFSPDVVRWCAERPDGLWRLLPSYDTVRRRRIPPELPLAVLRFGEEVATPHFRLQAYRSTDVGVSTVVTLRDGTTLFHAGDCNNWYFPSDTGHAGRVKVAPDQMEKLFLSILRDIRADHPRLDHAMFPIDPRLGQEMLRGALQLLRAIPVAHLHPMHYCLPPLPSQSAGGL